MITEFQGNLSRPQADLLLSPSSALASSAGRWRWDHWGHGLRGQTRRQAQHYFDQSFFGTNSRCIDRRIVFSCHRRGQWWGLIGCRFDERVVR